MLRRILVMPIVYGLLVIFAACAQPGQLVTPTAPPATATLAATLTPTEVPPTATATPTEVPTDTAVAPTSTPVLAALDTQTTTTTSPDGTWVAVSEAGFPVTKNGAACEGCSDQYWARFTVHRADGSQTWTPVAEWRQMGLGYTTPAVLQWAWDGQALYFTNLPHPDGCSVLVNSSDLLRLDLSTGAVTVLLPSSALWMTLSPDETQVAYMAYGQRGLVVRDLATGAEHDYPLADLGAMQAGAIVWAPDASAVALTVVNDPCGADQTRLVIAVTLADGARRVLVQPGAEAWVSVAWPTPERLQLTKDNTLWILNVTTGELTPGL